MTRITLLLLVLGLSVAGAAVAGTPPMLQAALQDAAAQGKPALVEFYTDW